MKYPSLLFLALPALLSAASPLEIDADRAALLEGISEIGAPGVPGGVSVVGPQAFALIAGKAGDKAFLPVVAATHWEKGRIVAFGHDGYLGAYAESGTGSLLANAMRWSAGAKSKGKIGVVANPGLAAHLKTQGLEAEALEANAWIRSLNRFEVICINAHKLAASDVEPLSRFVRGGGGLVTAATGWGWLYGGKEKSLLANEFAGNRLLEPAGLVFTAGTPGKTTAAGYNLHGELQLLNATAALEAIEKQAKQKLSSDQLTQCGATLADALRSLPPDDKFLLPRVDALVSTFKASDFPRPEKPLSSDQPLARLVVTRDMEKLRETRVEQIHAHPAAESFPGAVSKGAPRIAARTVLIDTAVPQWHSTGLYAAPGEQIRVQVPAPWADKGLGIRIGCHTDALWHLDKWQRAPEISRREAIKSAQSVAANPFGGLIYIDVPASASPAKISITIGGAVEAPRFVLGETSLLEWKTKLRNAPGAWAELETKKVILSVPSAKIRMLEDPEALMKFWDRILDAEADLASIPRERKRPERIVPDTQISAGYMHSGYPIMTLLDKSVDQSVSLASMQQGSWGHFHELGHNHQVRDWTFEGTTEVTCNLFSLYCMETVCGQTPGSGHDAMKADAVAKRLRGYWGSSDPFTRWKSDPFLALTMYDQLRAGFGWATYKKVFAEYQALSAEQRPKTDQERRDQWLIRFSQAAGKNLGPFFVKWGVPTSESARASLQNLPSWMPEHWPE